jgi:integrase
LAWEELERGRPKGKEGFWKTHEYVRRRVTEIEEFVGWRTIMKLIDECENTPYYDNPNCLKFATPERLEELRKRLVERDKALIATLFATGGRVSEVLMLRTENFVIEPERILVERMPLLKQIKRSQVIIDKKGYKPEGLLGRLYKWSAKENAWIATETVRTLELGRRLRFPIPLFEPTSPYLLDWLSKPGLSQRNGPGSRFRFLFPTSYRVRRELQKGAALHAGAMNLERRAWISPVRAYQIVRDVGKRIGIDIWPHWFRLNRFFGWKPAKGETMAQRYARLSVEDLWERMTKDKIRME